MAYPSVPIEQTFADVISAQGLRQLHIAETEKYAHVTFFFNGTKEAPVSGEERVIIPSPRVASYDEAPEMAATKIADEVLKAVRAGETDMVVANFANGDMVGHTGSIEATKKAVAVVDAEIGRIVAAVLAQDGVVFITADHGNAEEVTNLQTGDIDKEHSTNPVPFLIISNALEGQASASGEVPGGDLSLMPPVGMLADVAPTMLKVLGLPQPEEMTGTALL